MKKILLTAIGLIGVAGLASASNNFSYTATGTPGNTPDGTDQNSDPVNVWTLLVTPGSGTGSAQGAYEGTAFSGETLSGWQIWTSPGSSANGPGVSGSINASDTFAGGALSIGQTVSLNFEMRAANLGTDVGISLLNGSGNAITFGIYGGEASPSNPYTGSGYFYTDAGSTYASAGMAWATNIKANLISPLRSPVLIPIVPSLAQMIGAARSPDHLPELKCSTTAPAMAATSPLTIYWLPLLSPRRGRCRWSVV